MIWFKLCLCLSILLVKTWVKCSETQPTTSTSIFLSITNSITRGFTSTPTNTMLLPTLRLNQTVSQSTLPPWNTAPSSTLFPKNTILPSTLSPTDTTPPSTSPTKNTSSGFCARYTGTACGAILNESLPKFNKSKRYFDKAIGENRTEKFLKKTLETIANQRPLERCKRLLDVTFCQYVLSPCDCDGRLIRFCREDCEKLYQECPQDLNRLIGKVGAFKEFQKIDFMHLTIPTNCSIYPSGNSKEKSCVFSGLFDHSSSSSSPEFLFWVAVGAGPVLIIIITISCLISWKSKKRRKIKKAIEAMVLENLEVERSTMRDRVQQVPELSSLSSKIAELYDRSKLKQFSLDNIEYVSDLGEGQFGLVFKGLASGLGNSKDLSQKTAVAVKMLKHESNEATKAEFNQEAALMSVLDHPNIVKLLAVATEEDPYCMIFEFMELGDLNQFLRKVRPLDDTADQSQEMELCLDDMLSICSQVACGMDYLASLHFVHRDLATRNCLVGKEQEVKISDFGLSRDIYSSDYYKVRTDTILPIRWMPPEALLQGKFTVSSDIYSYGVLIWEVFTYGLQPFYGYSNKEVIAFAKQGVLLGQPDDCPTHIYDLMRDCWRRNPDKRPGFNTIIKRLVKDPPEVTYSTLTDPDFPEDETGQEKTAEIKQPTGSEDVSGPYQTAGTIINTGFISDDESEAVTSVSNSEDTGKKNA